ncbi:hypothetical protein ALQ07_101116 [Pseudomonas syringae pv. actinidiae]|uniref:Uncharacterized protein n=1 Tax=Pseudomonas syringae pv. actinidiae TaxID=103796 RepID=A0A3M4KD13_PSESF|nr:hypothetical protein ALQ07_101116 [Pseudomonas syringae pv. actinidiae]
MSASERLMGTLNDGWNGSRTPARTVNIERCANPVLTCATAMQARE